jgi:tripartite-type tricarboxylate transporter receptor subunit TctC
VPTLAELGYDDLVATTWWALSAPAGLPVEVADKINRAVAEAFALPQVKKQLAQDAVEMKMMTPGEVTQFMRAEIDKWVPVARRATQAR